MATDFVDFEDYCVRCVEAGRTQPHEEELQAVSLTPQRAVVVCSFDQSHAWIWFFKTGHEEYI